MSVSYGKAFIAEQRAKVLQGKVPLNVYSQIFMQSNRTSYHDIENYKLNVVWIDKKPHLDPQEAAEKKAKYRREAKKLASLPVAVDPG